MKESVLDVLMYLFEHYLDEETEVESDQESLRAELINAGFPDAAVSKALAWLDGLMAGREFVCGDKITLADVLLYCFLAFGKTVGQPYAETNQNVHAWFERMSKRPSVSA